MTHSPQRFKSHVLAPDGTCPTSVSAYSVAPRLVESCSCMPSSPVRKVSYPLASLSDRVSLQDSPVASSTTGVPNQGASNLEPAGNQQGCISPLTGTSPFQSHTPSPGRTFWGGTMVSVLVPWDLFSACSLFLSLHLFPSLSLQLPPQSTMRSPWD